MISIRRSRLPSSADAARGPGRLARLEMAVHLPGPGRRQRQPAGRPGRHAGSLRADLGERDERLLRPAARQHDLHDERHGDAAEPAGRSSRASSAACRRISAATDSPTCISRSRAVPPADLPPGSTATRSAGPALDARQLRGAARSRASTCAPFTYRDGRRRICSR